MEPILAKLKEFKMGFEKFERLFENDQFIKLASSSEGRCYLKIKSFSRKNYLEEFLSCNLDSTKIQNIKKMRVKEMLKSAVKLPIGEAEIDKFIKTKYNELSIDIDRMKLKGDLKEVEYDWGGLHQNSLEKTIVNNYVKKLISFSEISEKIDKEIISSTKKYVITSWYNYWTSFLIEEIFNSHPNVIPAIGKIKKIDFFVNGIPFDLKVTYLPQGYIDQLRNEIDLRPELTELKSIFRNKNIEMEGNESVENLWKELIENDKLGIKELKKIRIEILDKVQQDPIPLIKWLYENQGERRFDASNRIFLVLVDTNDFFSSWKLKRNFNLIKRRVFSELDNQGKNFSNKVEFQSQGKNHSVLAKLILIKR